MQTPAFTAALAALGVPARQLVLHDTSAVQMVQRRLPGIGRVGMISRSAAAPGLLRDAARAEGVTTVVLNPAAPSGPACRDAGFFPLFTPAHRALLPLLRDPEQQMAAQHQKWRNRLRHAQRGGLGIRRTPLPTPRANWVFDSDAAQARTRGYRPLPRPLIEALASQCRGAVQVFEAHQKGTAVAAMIFACHGTGATYVIGHSTAAGRTTSAHNLVLWEAMRWLVDKGVETLDLGLIDTVNAPGLTRFKLGAGAHVSALGGTWVHARGLNRIARALPRALLV